MFLLLYSPGLASGHVLGLICGRESIAPCPVHCCDIFVPHPRRVDSTKIRLQRFPTVALESALFPAKGLCATQAFAAGETIATFAKNDCRLSLLLMQHRKLPFPTATTCLVPFVCHCGSTHLRLKAADDLPVDTILLLGEPHNWQGCLVQFDGSAHKHTQTGGAGVSLLHITQTTTAILH